MLRIILFSLALAALLYFAYSLLRRFSRSPATQGDNLRELPGSSLKPAPAGPLQILSTAGAKPAGAEAFGPHVPQEHVLRRHFMTHVRAMLCTLAPCPSDSVLRRHHAHWIDTQMVACLRDPALWQRLEADYRSMAGT